MCSVASEIHFQLKTTLLVLVQFWLTVISYYLFCSVIQIEVGLDDPQSIGEDLGYLRFSLRIISLSDQKLIEQLQLANPTEEVKHVSRHFELRTPPY